MNYGFVKVAAAVPQVKVADCKFNAEHIQSLILQANNNQAEVVVFPELCLTGYTCADLFAQQTLLEEAEMQLIGLMNLTRSMDIISILGMPIAYNGALLNCAVVMQKGKLLGIVPKTFLPNYKEFNEKRWFTSAADVAEGQVLICGQQVNVSAHQLFRTPTFNFGIEICEDLWAPIPPSSLLALRGADVIFNLSADNDTVGKRAYLESLACELSGRLLCGYVYTGCGFGESTQDDVFRGKTLIYECGQCVVSDTQTGQNELLTVTEIDVERLRTERRVNTTFAGNAAMVKGVPVMNTDTAVVMAPDFRLTRPVDAHPFIPKTGLDERCQEVFDIQVGGLVKRIVHTNAKALVVGISGGLDSTLALLVSVRAIDQLQRDRRDIIGVTMPGFGTSDRTYTNAMQLMHQLGITVREISIKQACLQHFKDIDHNADTHDTTYENSQARERTQILMDVANQVGGMVVGTGDLSELALGWATYNGDHMSMYGVNGGVPKTLVQHIVRWAGNQSEEALVRETLLDIVDTPISPELIPTDTQGNIAQVTEDLVGPYELHDFFLFHFIRYGFRPRKIFMLAQIAFMGKYEGTVIKHWLTTFFRRFFAQQFKRSCLPDGPKVGSISLSPRTDWRMPSDASAQIWLEECNNL